MIIASVDGAILIGIGAFLAGCGSVLSGVAALRSSRQKGAEEAKAE